MVLIRSGAGVIVLLMALMGCEREAPVTYTEVARPVRVMEIAQSDRSGERRFPARIDASQRAEVAFRVSGRVSELRVSEGELVTEGTVLARLDPTDFNLVLQDRQARFDNAKRNYDRVRELIKGGAISQRDFDLMETNFKTTQTELAAARQNLDYTEMKAPFDGTISRRYVQRFEEVAAKQPIFNLQNLRTLEVKIAVTEGLVRSIRTPSGVQRIGANAPPAFVEFDDVPGERFEMTLTEAAAEADAQTQTFEVTFVMAAPERFRVLPGMTATALIDLTGRTDVPVAHWIPAAAVLADSNLGPRVWILDEAAGQVSARAVQVGQMQGDRIEVLEGLTPGDRVVTVGATFLAEGMKVFALEESEQAIPRANDPV